MRKRIPWWVSPVAIALGIIVSTLSSLYTKKYYPNWIIEYQLAFVMFCVIVAAIILIIIVKIIWHDCGDECRNQYDIRSIRSQYRKRK